MSSNAVSDGISFDANERYVLTSDVTYRFVAPGLVRATLGDRTVNLPAELHRLLLEFESPRRPSDVFADIDAPLEYSDFCHFIRRASANGLITLERSTPKSSFELLDVLGEGALASESTKSAVSDALRSDRAVLIPNAMPADFAASVHSDLDASSVWRTAEGGDGMFYYRHHNISNYSDFAPKVAEAYGLFESERTKNGLSDLSQRDCRGPLQFRATTYFPGDHSLPHADTGYGRSVAFIWYLSREWDPCWGGNLFWCPSGTVIVPQFNYLLLFNVSRENVHLVTAVSPKAKGRRLTLNGWWTSANAVEPGHESTTLTTAVLPPRYGREHSIVQGTRILLI